jgi:LeuA allosteric (dimerisation) domain
VIPLRNSNLEKCKSVHVIYMSTQEKAKIFTGNREELQRNGASSPLSVLIDVNLLVDYYFDRPSMWKNSINEIIKLIIGKKVNGYITESDLEKIWHLRDKISGEEAADLVMDQMGELFTVCKIDTTTVKAAMSNHFYNDFDCSLKSTVFKENNLDTIITSKPFNSPLDTQDPSLCAQTPDEFIDYMGNKDLSTARYESKSHNLEIGDWCISGFKVESLTNEISKGIVYYRNTKTGKLYSESVSGNGAIEVLCQAVDKIISSEILPNLNGYSLNSIKLKNRGEGVSSKSLVETSLRYDSLFFTGEASSKNSIEAAFYAYIKAASKIHKYCQYSPALKVFINQRKHLSASTLTLPVYLLIYSSFLFSSVISVMLRWCLYSPIRIYRRKIRNNHRRKIKNGHQEFTLVIGQWGKGIVDFIFTFTKSIDKRVIKTVEDFFPQRHSPTMLTRLFENAECWEDPFQ